MDNKLNGRLQQAAYTAAALASANPVLLAKELVYESDTGRKKIGDGVTTWNSLPYFGDTKATLAEMKEKLDGLDSQKEVILYGSSLDPNKYYPVTIPLTAGVEAKLRVYNIFNSVVPWGAHTNKGFTCVAQWVAAGSGYGAVSSVNRIIYDFQHRWTLNDVPPIGSIGQLARSSEEYIYVRGGANYYIKYSNTAGVPTLRTDPYTNLAGDTIQILSSVTAPLNLLSEIGSKVEDAPKDNKQYVRKDGAWNEIAVNIPSKVSAFENDAGYVTGGQVNNSIQQAILESWTKPY